MIVLDWRLAPSPKQPKDERSHAWGAFVRVRHFLLPLALIGCAGVPLEPAVDAPCWRGRGFYRSDDFWIAASSEAAATDVARSLGDARKVVSDVVGVPLTTGLVIAIDREDPPLIEDPDELAKKFAEWNGQLRGRMRISVPRSRTGEGADGVNPALVLKMVISAVPLDAPELELPQAICADATWAAVVPTKRCVSEVTRAILDAAFAETSSGKRLALSLLTPFARRRVMDEWERHARQRLGEMMIAASVRGDEQRREALAALHRAIGAPSESSVDDRDRFDAETYHRVRAQLDQQTSGGQ